MSSKILLRFLGGCLLVYAFLNVNVLQVQAVDSSALTGSQLSGIYDLRDDRETILQITNTSVTTPISIHVQLLSQPGCVDHDFTDTLTPADTVVYDLEAEFLKRNPVNAAGLPIPQEPGTGNVAADPNVNVDGTMGLVIITATSGAQVEAPAIAHNHLHGRLDFYNDLSGAIGDTNTLYTYNMVARSAVSSGGAPLADGSAVNGTTGFLEQIIPSVMHIHYTDAFDQNSEPVVFADLMMAAFSDDYTTGFYRATGATSDTYTKTVYDEDEQESSCNTISFSCNEKIGINNEHPSSRTVLSNPDTLTGCDLESSSSGAECHIAECKNALADFAPGPHPFLAAEDCNVLCDDLEVDFDEGYTRLRSSGGGTADVVYGILGLSTSKQGGAYRVHFE
jgi:hypothetical protein